MYFMDILLTKNKIITKFLCFLITALPFYNFVSGQSPNPTLTAKDLQPNYGWAWVDEFPWIYSASTSSWFYINASDTVSSFNYTNGSYLPFFSDTTKPSGWYWFSENFPFIYSHQTSSWTYLTGIDEGLLFYNSNHKAWRTFSNSLVNYYDPALKPFYHGVASGDPLQDAVIIWTRYTPDDEESGPFDISWTMATDNEMNAVVASGNASSKQENDFTVKVDVTGLSASTTYYYQFSSGSTKSVIGKTKTAPSSGAETIRLGLSNCANFPVGYFTAYRDMALRGDLDAVLNLGDYIYEYGDNDDLRPHIPSNEIVELDDYRARYSQYRLDPDLRLAHQHIPFISLWDDHEFANDSHKTGADNHDPSTEGSWDDRVIAAKKCYDEWMPIRPNVSSGNLYQKLPFGDLLDIFMTETNTYRDGPNNNDPVTGDYLVTATGQLYSVLYGSPQHLSPTRTQLGITQRDWLIGSLAASSAKWKIVGSSKVFSEMNEWFAASQFGDTPQNTESRTTDGWDGFPVERSTIIQSLQSLGVQGIAFVAGDAHITTSSEVVDQADTLALLSGAGSESLINYIATGEGSVAVEFATTSITSHNFDEGLLPFTNGTVEAAMGLAKQLETAFTTPIPLAALASLGVQPELFSSILPDGTITPNYHIKYANLTNEGYSVLTINPDEIQRDNYYVLNKSDHDAPIYWGGGTKTVYGTNKLSTAISEASPVNRNTFTSDPSSYIPLN